jgi:hypothetical protein
LSYQEREYCIHQLLKSSMYRNIGTALKFFRTYVKHLTIKKWCGLTPKQDRSPCVFYRQNKHGKTILVAVAWVDDKVFVRL